MPLHLKISFDKAQGEDAVHLSYENYWQFMVQLGPDSRMKLASILNQMAQRLANGGDLAAITTDLVH